VERTKTIIASHISSLYRLLSLVFMLLEVKHGRLPHILKLFVETYYLPDAWGQ